MNPTTVLFTAGRFGDAVAERLRQYLPLAAVHPVIAGDPDALAAAVAKADFVAVATWRPYPDACDAIDAACARAGVRWASAVLDQSLLWIGPIVDARIAACYRCYRRRYLTHHEAPERELVLERAYRQDPELGVPGFCDPVVEIAAAGLADAARAPAAAAGRFRRVHLLECTVEESRVVRVHGCPRCGGPAVGDPHDRYIRSLLAALPRELAR